MAQHDVQFSTQTQSTPPSDPFATPLTISGDNGDTENPDEWEYEYSNTETEIYYVTLDLSIPQDSKPQDARLLPDKPRATGIWVDPNIKISEKNAKRMKGNTNRARKANNGGEHLDMGENENLPEGSSAKKFSTPAPAPQIPEEKPDKPEKPTKVQILDLHSDQPLISYGGQIFAAEWTKNIGTEFLFTEHDADDSLPVLRNLSDDVDLIAASSIRLMSKPLELERRFGMQLLSTSESSPLIAPSAQGYHEMRRDQTNFLEHLSEIKKQKGEDDSITTVLKALPKNDLAWRLELTKRRNLEKAKLRKVIKGRADMREVERAQEMLAVMDEDDERRKTNRPPKNNYRKTVAVRASIQTSTPIPTINTEMALIPTSSKRRRESPVMETPIIQTLDGNMDDDDDGHYEDEPYDGDAPFEDDDAQMDDG